MLSDFLSDFYSDYSSKYFLFTLGLKIHLRVGEHSARPCSGYVFRCNRLRWSVGPFASAAWEERCVAYLSKNRLGVSQDTLIEGCVCWILRPTPVR